MPFAHWGGAPLSGLSRNQLQLLYNTPILLKKQRAPGAQALRLASSKELQAIILLIVMRLGLT
jgi:hypothetical protein